MSLVLDLALKQGRISKGQHARAMKIDRNRALGVEKAKLTRQRRDWAQRYFRKECSREEYLAEVLQIDARLEQLK